MLPDDFWGAQLYGIENCIKYAVGGTGFVRGHNFLMQMQEACADSVPDVDMVFVGGGINEQDVDVRPNLEEIVRISRESYPNAEIIVIPCCMGNWALDRWFMRLMCDIVQWCYEHNVKCVPFSNSVVYYNNCVQDDDIHPNSAGHSKLAKYISTHAYTDNTMSWGVYSHESNIDIDEFTCFEHNGYVTIGGRIGFTSAPQTMDLMVAILNRFRPNNDMFIPCVIGGELNGVLWLSGASNDSAWGLYMYRNGGVGDGNFIDVPYMTYPVGV